MHHRLKYENTGLHHRRGIWNTLCIHANAAVFITGIGTYTGDFKDLLDETLDITFDRTTTTINFWNSISQEMESTQTQIVNTKEARYSVIVQEYILIKTDF